jgi:hypothetical protein
LLCRAFPKSARQRHSLPCVFSKTYGKDVFIKSKCY